MKITIVGGGFGGVKCALELAKDPYNNITLISDKDEFQYYPALYGTATGHSHLESWVPLGRIFAGKFNVRVIIDKITELDPAGKKLSAESKNVYEYEHLVLALGSVTTYFGIKGLDEHSFGIKSEEEILELKHHLYRQIAEEQKLDKEYVIIGGGPTGVELAASLGTYVRRLCKRYGVPHGRVKITMLEAMDRILPKMHPKTSAKATKRLQKLGVKVQTNKKVESADDDGLRVNGKDLDSKTIIWTSGVANNPFFAANSDHFELAKNGKVVVSEYMRTKDGIYVIGDGAATPFSGLAQTALHDALFVAKNFRRMRQEKSLKKYKAVLPPVVVPVGDSWAAFEWRGMRIYGWVASLVRRVADFVGYTDILPLGQALGVWRAQTVVEDEYFTPTPKSK